MSQIELLIFQGAAGIAEAAALWLGVLLLVVLLVAGAVLLVRRVRRRRREAPDDWREGGQWPR